MPGGIHPSLLVEGSWPAANYVNPAHHGPAVAGLLGVLSTLTVLTVCLRLWIRLRVQMNAGLDDMCILLAMILTLGLSVVLCLATQKFGFSMHIWDLKIDQLIKGRQIVVASDSLYVVATGLTKISILLFYRRMAAGTISSGFLFAVHGSLFFVVAYMITFQFTIFFGCRPTNALWNQVDPAWAFEHQDKYSCDSELASVLAASGVSVVQDFIACGLPSILFWKLCMSRKEKLVLGSIFAVGFLICICGTIRMVLIARLYTTTYDVTWESQPIWILTGIEANLAIICASAPALKVFFERYLGLPSFTKRSGYFWSGSTFGKGFSASGNSDVEGGLSSKHRRKSAGGKWSWFDQNTVDTQASNTELASLNLAGEKQPGRHNNARRNSEPLLDELPLQGVVVTTEVETSISSPITSPKRIRSYGSQDIPRPSLQDFPPESLGPGVAYAGNYRRGKNM